MRARRALSGVASGTLLVVEATDPMAAIDIPNMVRETGDRLEAADRDGALLTFRIRRA